MKVILDFEASRVDRDVEIELGERAAVATPGEPPAQTATTSRAISFHNSGTTRDGSELQGATALLDLAERNSLSNTQKNTLEELLKDAEDDVTSQRVQLAKGRLLQHKRSLAKALCNLSVILHDLDRFAEAVHALDEAAKLQRNLKTFTSQLDVEHHLDLTNTLYELSKNLMQIRKFKTALARIQEALAIFEQMGSDESLPRQAMHARWLSLISACMFAENPHQAADALVPGNVAVGVYRKLVSEDPGLYAAPFAQSLLCQARILHHLETKLEAILILQEVVELQRSLYQQHPQTHAFALVKILQTLSTYLHEQSQYSDALTTIREALKIQGNQNSIKQDIVRVDCLRQLSRCLHALDMHADAAIVVQELTEMERLERRKSSNVYKPAPLPNPKPTGSSLVIPKLAPGSNQWISEQARLEPIILSGQASNIRSSEVPLSM